MLALIIFSSRIRLEEWREKILNGQESRGALECLDGLRFSLGPLPLMRTFEDLLLLVPPLLLHIPFLYESLPNASRNGCIWCIKSTKTVSNPQVKKVNSGRRASHT